MLLTKSLSEGNPDQPYPITLRQFKLVRELAFESRHPVFDPPKSFRRAAVEEIYHQLRSTGLSHDQAFNDVTNALPYIEQDENGFFILNYPENKNGNHDS